MPPSFLSLERVLDTLDATQEVLRRTRLHSRGTPRVSPQLKKSPVFLPPLELEKQCQASCRIDLGIGGFLSRCHRAVTPAIVFRVDTQETVESVQGNQLYMEWIGTSGYFGIVSRPLEFLSSFKMRPPLEV